EIENFKLDLDKAIKSIEQSGVNPIFPKRLWKSVLRDEYIELTEFADALELSTLVKPTPTKAIIDQSTWHRAWRATVDAISFAFTNWRSKLVAYEEHIGQLFDDNLTSFHRNILNYDKAVRQLIGSRCDILFNEFKHAEVARFRTMYLLPTGTHFSILTLPAPRPDQGGSRPHNRTKEICRKFNQGNCNGCEQRHLCATCGESGHGAQNCRRTARKWPGIS
ncbi:hypothetical protein EV368DRAFT_53173, partial [Lentinula lateritia]